MQKKLNEDFIDSYCEKFASKVSSNIFKNGKEVISGREILSATPSKQVNFFVIKLLFRYWQEETKKLESPFFNYKHEEVRQAMIQFMNVLSQHIEIRQDKFEILLNHAVKDTIYLAAMPQAYVEIDLDTRGVETITDKAVEGTVKYLKVHKKEIYNFLSDMKGLTIDDVIDELPDEFGEFDTTEAVGELSGQLAKILEISPEKIFSEDPDIEDFDEKDLFERGEEDLVDSPSSPRRTALGTQSEDNTLKVSSDDDAMKEEKIPEDAFPRRKPTSGIQESDERSDRDRLKSRAVLEPEDREDDFPSETINKKFEQREETVAEHHEKRKGNNLLDMISLNNRYMFIRELFKNDKNEFENALFELENYGSFDASVDYLVQSYAKPYQWDMQSEEVKEFLKVLFRYFR